jgi:hypothetical protein
MSAEDKLKILIADKLHDFTDRTRMTTVKDKTKIVNYIETSLLDILRKYYSNIQEKDLKEDMIVESYYPKVSGNKQSITTVIKSEQDLYDLNPADFIFTTEKENQGKIISMEKYLFQYVPKWLYTLYNNKKKFMLDVTVLTESDICNNLLQSKDEAPFILKSIATAYDRNVKNVINEPCSKEDDERKDVLLFTKKNGELTGFDSISLKSEYKLTWTLNSNTGTININKIIESKKNSRQADSDNSPMSLPMFFDMINKILNNTEGSKRNALNSLNAKISSLYDLNINEVIDNEKNIDIDTYIMCLTDLKSMGDLLQVKMAELSKSIFVSNDRTTCLMSTIGYNNPTLRTSKTRVDGVSIREFYLFHNNFKYDPKTMELLKEAQEKRKREEEILTQKKIEFIKLLKTFIEPIEETIIETIDDIKSKIEDTKIQIKNTESATLQTIVTGRRSNKETFNFNYDNFKLRLEKILLQYHIGFYYLLLQLKNQSIEKIIQDRTLINIYIDESIENQEDYIQENLDLLRNLLKDIPLMSDEKRVARDFVIYKLKLFNYPHLDIIKMYNELAQMKQLSNKTYTLIVKRAETIQYTVGFFDSQRKLNDFIEDLTYLEDKAERFFIDRKNGYETMRKRKASNDISSGGYTSKRKTKTNKITFKKITGITKKFTKTTQTLNTIRTTSPSLASSDDLINIILHFLVNKYKEVTKTSTTEANIIKVLIFQILFYVDLYDISMPIFDISIRKGTTRTSKKTTTRQTNRVTGKKPITKLSPIPEEGGSISNKKFQFSQNLISQFLDRLRL